jgi:uncharacterized protein
VFRYLSYRILICLIAVLVGGTFLLILLVAEKPDSVAVEHEREKEKPAEDTEDPAGVMEEAPSADPAREDAFEAPPVVDDAPRESRLYLILDDAGYSVEEIRVISGFRYDLTLAVLPALPYSAEVARLARAAGVEVMLHQPMEAVNGEDPGPSAIFLDQSAEMIRSVVRRNLRDFPDIQGVNNHMGSRITSDFSVMTVILKTLYDEGVPFLDSRTTADSVATEAGAALGVIVPGRDVFLDHVRNRTAIEEQLESALAIAREKGYAVLIGHITVPETIEVLIERQEEIIAEGFRFYPVSDLFRRAAERS